MAEKEEKLKEEKENCPAGSVEATIADQSARPSPKRWSSEELRWEDLAKAMARVEAMGMAMGRHIHSSQAKMGGTMGMLNLGKMARDRFHGKIQARLMHWEMVKLIKVGHQGYHFQCRAHLRHQYGVQPLHHR